MRRRASLLAVALCGAASAFAADAPAGAVGQPLAGSLTGRWQLNKSESEDARAKMAAAREARRADSGGSGGGMGRGRSRGHGGFGGGARGGAGRGGGGEDRSMATRQEFFVAADTLTITGNDTELTLDDGDGQLQRLPLDGRSHPREADGTETTARWTGSALEVASKAGNAGALTTTYRLVPEARKLEVTSVLSGRRGSPVSVRRVYDAVPGP